MSKPMNEAEALVWIPLMAEKARTFENNWDVQCFGCGAVYIDHRRRVGKCLKCKSAAVIVTRR